MIALKELSLLLGAKVLLELTSLNIYSEQKLGIIGRNGAGKTSLFKLLMGEYTHDMGELDLPAGIRKSQMLQETAGSELSAVEYVIDGDKAFRNIDSKLKVAEEKSDFDLMAALHGEMELIDGYSITNRAEQLLSGLGFVPEEFSKSVNGFSGGWRIRLNLAQALMTPSDLLLLDEPTNHLDLEATLWLQQWLQVYPGTLLLISHDRNFLDQVVTNIISFENKKLILYKGGYSDYEKQKAERLAQQQAVYEKQQIRKSEIEDFVRRFRAKATKARQAQSRLKELDRMVMVAPAHVDSPFKFQFFDLEKQPASLLACEHISLGYERPLISDFSINIRGDSRIGLLGANGKGKSTLLKVLQNQELLLAGEIQYSDHLKIGYCAQHQVDVMDVHATPLELIQRLGTNIREQEVRNFLGGFDFQDDRVGECIEHFSGGEKSRLALAMVVWQKPNLLLLDEPTNHLDLEMRHALTVALQEFKGALILVSHDRHLLNNTVDTFLLIKDGKLEHFDGDLSDYENLLLSSSKNSSVEKVSDNSMKSKMDKKESRQQAAESRELLKPLTLTLKKLETKMDRITTKCNSLDARLLDTEIYNDENKQELNVLLKEQGELSAKLAQLEEEWMEASEALDALKAAHQ